MWKVLILLAIAVNLSSARPKTAENELVAVAVVFRHGDRTIISTYPNDPYKDESNWPVGFGQLTNAGKQRHYELGQWFRARYDTFLPKTYSPKDIYVRSTIVDRSLMSGAANLAGLYPPEDNDVWESDMPWQPIPIHTRPQDVDEILAMKKPCPKYNQLLLEFLQGEFVSNLVEQNQDILDLCTKNAGQNYSTLEDIEYLHDTLKIEKEDFGFKLPDWTNGIYPERTEHLAGISFASRSYTPELQRLKGGPFLDNLINHFKKVLNGTSDAQKFLMFPAHDTTVAALSMSLGSFDTLPPPYAATLIFELHKGTRGPYIKLYYKKLDVVSEINAKNCMPPCPFEEFIEVLKPVTVDSNQWIEECIS